LLFAVFDFADSAIGIAVRVIAIAMSVIASAKDLPPSLRIEDTPEWWRS
jgi:hypothetical protein